MILEADAVAEAESHTEEAVLARSLSSSGVCVVGMHEIVQSRNLGGPGSSRKDVGTVVRNRLQAQLDETQEVGLFHSIREAE